MLFENKHYVINYPLELEEFIAKAVENAEGRKQAFEDLFEIDWDNLPKLKASFFITREEFLKYIKELNGFVPGPNAIGCFCDGEIQALVDIENMYKNNSLYTLAHETIHLFIQKIYKDKNRNYIEERIRWFDEAYAYYLERPRDNSYNKHYYAKALALKEVAQMDVNILDDRTKLNTEKYNSYNIFQVLGKYIFDNNLQKEYLRLLKDNPRQLRKIGETILKKSVEYVLQIATEV